MIFEEIVEFIEKNYANTRKIVEVGVGKRPEIALKLLEKLKAEVIVTDVKLENIKKVKVSDRLRTVLDDIFNPNWEVYREADLIYALRPNPEIQKQIIEVAFKVGADALMMVISDEWPETENKNMKHKIINYKGATLHIFINTKRRRKHPEVKRENKI